MAFFGKEVNRENLDTIHYELPKENYREKILRLMPKGESPLSKLLKEHGKSLSKEEILHYFNDVMLDESELIIYEKQLEDESSSSE